MKNYKITINRTKRSLFTEAVLKSKTVTIITKPKKGHLHIKIKVANGKFRKTAQTSIMDNLSNDELKIVLNYFYNKFSNESCVIGIEHSNYAQIFGSYWL